MASFQFFTLKQKTMKIAKPLLIAAIAITFTSCATVFGGRVNECQRTKPAPGQPGRQVRAVPLIANILLFWPGIAVDFITRAAYKPCQLPGQPPVAGKTENK
jgi:hypothetical protein